MMRDEQSAKELASDSNHIGEGAYDAARVAFAIRSLREFTPDDIMRQLSQCQPAVSISGESVRERLSYLVSTGWIRFSDGRYRT